MVELEDAESGERILVDFSHKNTRKLYEENSKQSLMELKESFLRTKCEFIELKAGQDILEPLHRFFRRRERRLNHFV